MKKGKGGGLPGHIRMSQRSALTQLADELKKRPFQADELMAAVDDANIFLSRKAASDVAVDAFIDEPDTRNPYVVICQRCSRKQHIEQETCFCGSFLRGQVLDDYSRWVHATDEQLDIRSRRTKRFGNLAMFVGFGPILTPIGSNFVKAPFQQSLEQLLNFSGLFIIPLYIAAPLGFHFWRRADGLQEIRKQLCFENYLFSEYKHALPKSYRKRRTIRFLRRADPTA